VGLDRNPLRRRVDKIETYVVLVLVALFTLAAPVAAWRTGQVAYRDGVRTERIEQAEWTRTEAILTGVGTPVRSHADSVRLVRVPARWTAPDGTARTGYLSVAAGSRVGTRVPIWVDRSGRRVAAPQTHAGTVAKAAMLAGLVVLGIGGLLIGVAILLRRACDRRRLADWQSAWLRTEPLWTGRRRAPPTDHGA